MSQDDVVLSKLHALPPHRRGEILDFLDFLLSKEAGEQTGARQSVRGLCADLEVDLDRDEIDRARAELWATFPRSFG